MPVFRSVDASVFERPDKPTSKVDPTIAVMVTKLSRITDASIVYHVSLDEGEKASTVRGQLLRAAKVAGVEVAVRKAPTDGWLVGLMTPERRSTRGRRARVGGAV